jgi:hypothetical protein
MPNKDVKQPAKQIKPKNNPADTRKHPAPGYDELNPKNQSEVKKPVKQPK